MRLFTHLFPSITPQQVYTLLTCVLITIVLLETIIAPLYITWGSFVCACDVFTLPIGCIIMNMIAEIFGIPAGRRALGTSYVVHVLAISMAWMSQQLPTTPTSPVSTAFFEQLLGGNSILQLGTASIHWLAQGIALVCFSYFRKLKPNHFGSRHVSTIVLVPWLTTCITCAYTIIMLYIHRTFNATEATLSCYAVLGPPILQTVLGLMGLPIAYAAVYRISKLGVARIEN